MTSLNPDLMQYFVLCQFKSGLVWAERNPANMSRRDTIADIMTGDLENVVKVMEANEAEHIWNDVTEDIMAEAGCLLGIGVRTEQDALAWLLDHTRDHRKVDA